jgi:multidrug efflux pump subunit AcrB
LQRSEFWQQ